MNGEIPSLRIGGILMRMLIGLPINKVDDSPGFYTVRTRLSTSRQHKRITLVNYLDEIYHVVGYLEAIF